MIDLSSLSEPLPLLERYGMRCRGVIHVGASFGLEFHQYRAARLQQVVYIEPLPQTFEKLRSLVSGEPGHHAIRALCSDEEGVDVVLNVASNPGSSSILELGSHLTEHPDVRYIDKVPMRTTTVDRLIFDNAALRPELLDCLVIDVQGAELKVLRGARRTLGNCRFVFAEVSDGGLYVGDCSLQEIVDELKPYGFKLRQLGMNIHKWGNALFIRD